MKLFVSTASLLLLASGRQLAPIYKGQICQVASIEVFQDASCTIPTDDQFKPSAEDFNAVIKKGPTCQTFGEDQSLKKTEGHFPKVKITCLSKDTLKFEQFNWLQEDPTCKFSYSPKSQAPSFISKNGECQKYCYQNFGCDYYWKLTVEASETAGTDVAKPWDLVDNAVAKDNATKYHDEWDKDQDGDQCLVTEIKTFSDEACENEIKKDKKNETLQSFNRDYEIDQKDCASQLLGSYKRRAYCENATAFSVRKYDYFNEDPKCLRSYPSTVSNSDLRPETVTSGKCVLLGQKYSTSSLQTYRIFTVEKNPNSCFYSTAGCDKSKAVYFGGKTVIAAAMGLISFSYIF